MEGQEATGNSGTSHLVKAFQLDKIGNAENLNEN